MFCNLQKVLSVSLFHPFLNIFYSLLITVSKSDANMYYILRSISTKSYFNKNLVDIDNGNCFHF